MSDPNSDTPKVTTKVIHVDAHVRKDGTVRAPHTRTVGLRPDGKAAMGPPKGYKRGPYKKKLVKDYNWATAKLVPKEPIKHHVDAKYATQLRDQLDVPTAFLAGLQSGYPVDIVGRCLDILAEVRTFVNHFTFEE